MSSLSNKLRHRILLLRLKSIRVFVFHQVSDMFNPDSMWECDWTQTETFKRAILELKKSYVFIPLADAHRHLQCDRLRWKRYAVLTADDGWESLRGILPWLAEQHIHITLFLNPLYLDGEHKQYRSTERFLMRNEVSHLVGKYHPYISVASHGWSHKDCSAMDMPQFQEQVAKAEQTLACFPNKIPFYAFAWGKHKKDQVDYLRNHSLVPVFVDGLSNINDPNSIHRECLDGKKI